MWFSSCINQATTISPSIQYNCYKVFCLFSKYLTLMIFSVCMIPCIIRQLFKWLIKGGGRGRGGRGNLCNSYCGKLDYFLGIQASHITNGSMLLSQTKYIQDLLSKVHMEEAKDISSPMISSRKLTKQGSNYFHDPTLYRSIVGALQYVTIITRPEICFSVNEVWQFMGQPLEEHRNIVKRILRYLKGTLTHGLLLQPTSSKYPLPWLLFVMQIGKWSWWQKINF